MASAPHFTRRCYDVTIPRIIRHQCNESLEGLDSGVSEVPVEFSQQVVNLFRRTTELFE